MGSADINPNWGVESSIRFFSRGDHEGANFIYEAEPPFSSVEYRALISTGLMLSASVDGNGIDPDGESIVEPMAMENYVDGKAVSTPVKVSGESEPKRRISDLYKIAGALTVMRNVPVKVVFDEEAQRLL